MYGQAGVQSWTYGYRRDHQGPQHSRAVMTWDFFIYFTGTC